MATQPIGSQSGAPSPYWLAGSSTYNRVNLLAAVRAGLIALALLTILVVIVLL